MLSEQVRVRIKRGDPIPADWLNQIANAVIEKLMGGRGVQIKRVGNKIVISMTASQIIPKL